MDGAVFCPACGAPLALRPEPSVRPLDASVSLDRRAAVRTPVATAPLALAETQGDLTQRLDPVPEPPARTRNVAARAPAVVDPSRSHWDLGSALGGAADRTFAPGELPLPADSARTGLLPRPAAGRAPPLDAPGPVATRPEPSGLPRASVAAASEPGGPALAAEASPEPALDLGALPDPEVDAVEVHLRRAPTWRRIAAWAIDCAPFVALLVFALRALQAGDGVGSTWGRLGAVAADAGVTLPVAVGTVILLLVYQTLCHALAGATLGKWIAGLRVVGPDGARPSLGRSTGRAILSVVSVAVLGLGLLLALFTVSGRALHDLLARTWVVEAP
ncbi:hypothetical protein AMOR_28090 [Anaeromyxobacter oryzae]|uniref:RDD domain-containing protein n=2 Tax=Anaeromyxobacter oryzae TaxID=2918170 RepID=A0ABN6MVS0_9BACT|nr:hypothetical protein AMOR_28090 [Anaeromyxobacter oryzae]